MSFGGRERTRDLVVETTGPRPGDDWYAVASTRNTWCNGITFAYTQDQQQNWIEKLVDGDGADVPAQCVSPMLTCWRKLHVELDSQRSRP